MSKLPFFKHGQSAFHSAIALKLRPQVCLAGDFVIRVGDLAREMYIAHRGRLRVIAPHQERLVKNLPMEDEMVSQQLTDFPCSLPSCAMPSRINEHCDLQVTFKIETGMLFGEGALMVSTKPGEATTDQQERLRRRNASIQAITFCFLFELAAIDFAEVCATCSDVAVCIVSYVHK